MLNESIRPTSIVGVKRLATQIKKAKNLKHSAALNLASQAAGFDNFKHAQNSVNRSGSFTLTHVLYITKYWRDEKTYKVGRETLLLQLSKPLLELCKKTEIKSIRGLGASRLVAEDHLVSDTLSHSQEFARDQICKAVRSIRFMEHTALRPRRGHHVPFHDIARELPGNDHTTDWYDPSNGQLILMDEPYVGVPDLAKRAAWADQHNWYLRKSEWQGIYYPYSCDMFLATDAGKEYDFEELMRKVDAIPAPITMDEWRGETADTHETFFSPAAKTPQDRRRAKSKATIYAMPSKTTMPYRPFRLDPTGQNTRKPRGNMPFDTHVETGHLIKAVLNSSERPYDIYWRLNRLRSTLEDWMEIEFKNNFPEELDAVEIYFGNAEISNPFDNLADSERGIIQLLEQLKSSLKQHYPECKPLLTQIGAINFCIKTLKSSSKKKAA